MEHQALAAAGASKLQVVDPAKFPPGLAENGTLAEITHEARNIISALGVCCDLLKAPGVLTTPNQHLAGDLRIVVAACRHLVEKLCALENNFSQAAHPAPVYSSPLGVSRKDTYWEELPPMPINDLAWELERNRELLAALAGPAVTLSVECHGAALPVSLSSEDLTRILVNLVKNAVEAMPRGGRILLSLREAAAGPGQVAGVILNVEDSGTGIPPAALERIFEAGYTTRSTEGNAKSSHRGQGLAITRSILQSAGGAIRAANRDPLGACFQIELPVRPV